MLIAKWKKNWRIKNINTPCQHRKFKSVDEELAKKIRHTDFRNYRGKRSPPSLRGGEFLGALF